MNPDNEVRGWQFSLRSFLVVVLIVGPITGVVVPIILDAITEWKPPPQQMPSRVIPQPHTASTDSEGYYESGETPLN